MSTTRNRGFKLGIRRSRQGRWQLYLALPVGGPECYRHFDFGTVCLTVDAPSCEGFPRPGTRAYVDRLRRKYEDMLFSALSLVHCKALPIEGGYRLGVEVDGELASWLCSHNHPTICEAERCPDALADRPRHADVL